MLISREAALSVRCIDLVLNRSQHAGTELLMLVVLADYSDDDGNSYPSVASLARKCRMTHRNANYILGALQASGELRVMKNEGPKGTNRYRIMLSSLGASEPLKAVSSLKRTAPLKTASPPEAPFTLKPTSSTPEAGFPKPLKPASDEPSLNRQEPSHKATSSPAGLPACPHRELIAQFVEKVPELPAPRAELWAESAAAKDLAARWKWVLSAKRATGQRYATTRDEALAWFGRFFEAVAGSDFLTGRSGKWSGCNLQWLVKAKNFAKVIEGNYNREAAAA
jgi:hypothetical protein